MMESLQSKKNASKNRFKAIILTIVVHLVVLVGIGFSSYDSWEEFKSDVIERVAPTETVAATQSIQHPKRL